MTGPRVYLVGHATRDYLPANVAGRWTPGGITYLAAFYLSAGARTSVLTNVSAYRSRLSPTLLREAEWDASRGAVPHRLAISSRSKASGEDRSIRFLSMGSQIRSPSFRPGQYDLIHLCPQIAGDIAAPIFSRIRQMRVRWALDLQGVARRRGIGEILLRPSARDVGTAAGATFLKGSVQEICAVTSCANQDAAANTLLRSGSKEIWVTDGSNGAFLYSSEGRLHWGAEARGPVVDTTGCGDLLFASYCWARTSGYQLRDAAQIAIGMAGAKSTLVGPGGAWAKHLRAELRRIGSGDLSKQRDLHG